jgi:hypothetical protein
VRNSYGRGTLPTLIEECRNWMPEPYRITPEELEEINQLLEEMDKMEQ